ncbi:hypothetical protein [Nocardioides sp. zg-1230]|uniref:hypothetical protein n=1 Tax=Nocardioides sp. zg-1230 TaxID=2736601 RepID=UPI0015576841|nr:hypothetical protein [Nocardioides sp. zg-1230]NPC43333.1 hypothetical protein [Nocardioides sp. zg-1230]NPC44763.1 hypothetical protein [Nocardioides sp. zg-1230]
MRSGVWRVVRVSAAFVVYGALAAAVLGAPVAAERAVEAVRIEDRLGTVPVELSLTHHGRSVLDTGVLGSLYWDQTGALGFGARVRVTDTPQADGTLASYASPRFVRANAVFVSAPEQVAGAYGDALRSQLLGHLMWRELAAFMVGGLVMTAVFRARSPIPAAWSRRRSIISGAVALVTLGAVSWGTAAWLFARWEGNAEVPDAYAMPGISELSFSSPQSLEIARQVRPFLEKNNERIQERTRTYLDEAEESLAGELTVRAGDLAPRDGELVVLAEADPQGSHVGTRVRTLVYAALVEAIGVDAFAVRTISGGITSNGTIAEAGFVEVEVAASGEIPTVVVKGDHDTGTTLEQLSATSATNPHFDPTEVSGLRIVAGNDPAFKTLFGGTVVNETGVSETELGEQLRTYVDDEDPDAVVVLLHQPRSAAGYLGLGSLDDLPNETDDRPLDLTTPVDDGIPDVPPGIVNIGHLHDAELPRVVWNTDGDETTWTVVNQLGTSGGVEERPTFNRFSTPYSAPLKRVSIQLQYVDRETGLQTGYASIEFATDGVATVAGRTDLGQSE